MTQAVTSFQVRYTGARGLAALFERPTNSYGWSGSGQVSIEPHGVRFSARRRRRGIARAEDRFVRARKSVMCIDSRTAFASSSNQSPSEHS